MNKNNTETKPETAAKQETGGDCPSATCSGFVVVIRHEGTHYKNLDSRNPDNARGYRADEIWIFGSPVKPTEMQLSCIVAPMLTWIPDRLIHYIPNAEVSPGACAHPGVTVGAIEGPGHPGHPDGQHAPGHPG